MPQLALLSRSNLSEQQLLKKIQAGNISAFWPLWLRYQPYLSSRCLQWTGGNHSDAEDILSLAMYRAWEQIPRYADCLENPKAWLTKLTHNLCVNQQVKRRRQAISLGNIENSMSDNHSLPIGSSLELPEYALLRQEIGSYLNQLIRALAPQLRAPLLLHYYQGLSCSTIARQQQLSLASVYKRLQIARDILRPQVRQYLAGHSHLAIVPIATDAEPDWSALISQSVPYSCEKIDYTIIATCLISRFPGSCK
ncbi:MAG: RNA polymerase sigma factor [Symploca sp. SIO2G7]|nr:RNA polymerase sigma factor [Symploca sp. SIO2G7]